METEKLIDFTFPNDYKQLYLRVNGFKDWDWRTNMFSVWPIERTLEDYQECDTKKFISFADFLINCHSIGFVKGRVGIYKWYGYEEFELISNSFLDSILLINADSKKIY